MISFGLGYVIEDADFEQVRQLVSGYEIDDLLEASYEGRRMDVKVEPGFNDEVNYEIRIWGQEGRELRDIARNLIPGTENVARIRGSVDYDEIRQTGLNPAEG